MGAVALEGQIQFEREINIIRKMAGGVEEAGSRANRGDILLSSHYTTLHYIKLHYITLYYIILHFITLHYITLRFALARIGWMPHYITLHYIALHKFFLQDCNFTSQYFTLCCTVLHYIAFALVGIGCKPYFIP